MTHRIIKQCITDIYAAVDDFEKDSSYLEVRYWLLNSDLGENENYIAAISEIYQCLKAIPRYLGLLTEVTEDLEVKVNRCGYLIRVETEKNQKFANDFNKRRMKLEVERTNENVQHKNFININ